MTKAARAEVLTAEVRILQLGARQVTAGMARQLDYEPLDDIEPFGRLNIVLGDPDIIEGTDVIGRHRTTGALVRSGAEPAAAHEADLERIKALPLIVLGSR